MSGVCYPLFGAGELVALCIAGDRCVREIEVNAGTSLRQRKGGNVLTTRDRTKVLVVVLGCGFCGDDCCSDTVHSETHGRGGASLAQLLSDSDQTQQTQAQSAQPRRYVKA